MGNLSSWLMDEINVPELVSTTNTLLGTPTNSTYSTSDGGYSNSYTVYSASYSNYSNYNNYSNYMVYDNYSNYSNYKDYYNYYNYSVYSNTITITTNPTAKTVTLGNSVTFAVVVSQASMSDVKYQWYMSSSASGGTAISGATSASYTFTPTTAHDGKYFYCVISRGTNSQTSSSAKLTVIRFDSVDISVATGTAKTIKLWKYPTSATVTYTSSSTAIATVSSAGVVTGVTAGTASITITCSNGISKTINVIVYGAGKNQELAATFKNIAIAIRKYKGKTNSIRPNQFYNMFVNGTVSSKSYASFNALFTELATAVRSKGASGTMTPVNMYEKILGLIG